MASAASSDPPASLGAGLVHSGKRRIVFGSEATAGIRTRGILPHMTHGGDVVAGMNRGQIVIRSHIGLGHGDLWEVKNS